MADERSRQEVRGCRTDGDNQQWYEGWHIGKRLGIPELLMTVSVIFSMVYWFARADSRVELNTTALNSLAEITKQRAETNARDITNLRVDVATDLDDIKKRLQSIESSQSAQLSRIEQKIDTHLVDHSRDGGTRKDDR